MTIDTSYKHDVFREFVHTYTHTQTLLQVIRLNLKITHDRLFACLLVTVTETLKLHQISKIAKPKCVSRHSVQRLIFDPYMEPWSKP